ncbi:MAG: hypothetical protein Q4B18_02490 [Bacillota bacterium]|nr:hypothetical protein [Bacillota bacterium]
MKKLLIIVLAMIMAFAMASCGGGGGGEESPYAGTWTATTCSYAGIEMDCASIFGGDFIITIENGGKYTIDLVGEGDKGNWEESENGVLLDGELEMAIDGNTGTLEYEGVLMYFEKE